MKRLNTWSDATQSGRAELDLGDGLRTSLPLGQVPAEADLHNITVDTSVGTRVFVGDTMIYGDTGWRDVSGLLRDGWSGILHVSRENNNLRIYGELTGEPDSNAIFVRLPQGFRSEKQYAPIPAYFNHEVRYVRILNNDFLQTGVSTKRLFINATVAAQDSWPTSLPGLPA